MTGYIIYVEENDRACKETPKEREDRKRERNLHIGQVEFIAGPALERE